MKLEYRLGFTVTENLNQTIEAILTECINLSKISRNDLDKIYIADKSTFGNALKEISDDHSYTDNEMVTVAGKTISYFKGDRIVSSIIFSEFVMGVAISGKYKYKNYNEWEPFELLCFYAIHHELGHCYDDQTRKHLKYLPIKGSDNLFKVSTVNNYYYDILISELCACVFSSYIVHEKIIQQETIDLISNIQELFRDIELKKIEYKINQNILYDLAFSVSGAFWFILIQFSKLIGFKIGNKSLGKISIIDKINYGIDCNSFVIELENLLLKNWDSYPNFANEMKTAICKIWNNFCLANGYQFSEGIYGDGLSWRK